MYTRNVCGGALILKYELIEKQWRIMLAHMPELVHHPVHGLNT